jgi:hypothetical protein
MAQTPEQQLRALMQRDAKVWRARQRAAECGKGREGASSRMTRPGSMRARAMQLLETIDHLDADGRPVGLNYDQIRAALVQEFPVVTTPGLHFGKPTAFAFKELHAIACELRRSGEILPIRQRCRRRRMRATP